MSPIALRYPPPPASDDGGGLIQVVSPFDDSLIGTVPVASHAEIEEAVARAGAAAAEFRHSTPFERRSLLEALAKAIAEDAEPLARLITAEVGKTIREARAEIRRAQSTLRLSGDAATFLDGEVLHVAVVSGAGDRRAVVTHVPVGIVAAITPFNYPLNLLCHKLGPAIAAGNAVVAKPSPKAPLAAARLAELAIRAGFPGGLFQVVHGGAEQALALARSPINLLSFTGGPAAGLALKRASGLVRCLMELGGNDPLVVMPDADIRRAVETSIAQRFEIAGQSCAAVKRLYLHAEIKDAFVERLLAGVAALSFGNPADPATDMGPLIDLAAAEDVDRRVAAEVTGGARVLAGGSRERTLMAPTVVDGVLPAGPLIGQETFGPVIAIRSFTDPGAVIREVNAGQYGLQAGLFTNDHALIKRFARELQVGGLMVNEGPDFRAEHVPFGGVKTSGLGREGVRIAIREMSETRVVID